MELFIGLIVFWAYTIVGVIALAIFMNRSMCVEQDYGAATGAVYLILWPIVITREIMRRQRMLCVQRVLSLIQDHALRASLAYQLLGRYDGDRVLQEIA